MLDRDLAALYGVSTKAFNQAVKRHKDRFPPDFMFQLTMEEAREWWAQGKTNRSRSQTVTLNQADHPRSAQFVISKLHHERITCNSSRRAD